MDGRPVVTLGAKGLIIVTHEDAVYVLDKKKALDTRHAGAAALVARGQHPRRTSSD